MSELAREVPIASHVRDYVVRLVLTTHPDSATAPAAVRKYVRYGASPRGAQAIVLGAKIRALLEGRLNVAFEDIRALAAPALRHRLVLNFEGEAEGLTTDEVIVEVLAKTNERG
jgi:MoxR-like ATPase